MLRISLRNLQLCLLRLTHSLIYAAEGFLSLSLTCFIKNFT